MTMENSHASRGKWTSTQVPVNMSKWTVFTEGLKRVWGRPWFRGMAPGPDRMLGVCVCVIFLPTPLVMRETHKEILLHTNIHPVHTCSGSHSQSERTSVFGSPASSWAQRKYPSALFFLPPSCFELKFQHAEAHYIKHLHFCTSFSTKSRTRTCLSLILIQCLPGAKWALTDRNGRNEYCKITVNGDGDRIEGGGDVEKMERFLMGGRMKQIWERIFLPTDTILYQGDHLF